MRLWKRPPKRLHRPHDEAVYYAKLYMKEKDPKERKKIYESLLVNGSKFDIIIRSCLYLNIFENEVGKKFDFWY